MTKTHWFLEIACRICGWDIYFLTPTETRFKKKEKTEDIGYSI